MHVTACLAGQKVDVEVGEDCRSLQALKEAIVVALPKLCVEGFDVSVGGRALDDDEGIVSLEDSACLDVSANTRGLSTLALCEAGREVGEDGLLAAVGEGDVAEGISRRHRPLHGTQVVLPEPGVAKRSTRGCERNNLAGTRH